jgi:phosphonate transport system substrate-binding protein
MIRYLFVFVFVLASLPLQAAPTATPASYRLGIFPYMAPRQTVQFYGPIAASMEAALKHPVRLESVQTFPAFGRALAKYSYDIALIQPFDYPAVVEKLGYLPLAQFSIPLVTQFFVRDDSRYQKIEDLRGTTVAMPPAPAANSRMALRALNDNRLIPGSNIEVRHFNSHDSCIQQVWAGTASACATASPPIQVFEQRMHAKLRAIYSTPPIPHVMFVANPRVPAEQRARLQELITGWSQTEDGRAMLKNLGFPGFIAPKPAEYAVMSNYDPAATDAKNTPAAAKELMLGVFPFLGARQLAQNFAPTLPALSKSSGMPVHLRTATNSDSFGDAVASATYDIVLVQSFNYAMATRHGYLPLAGMNERLQGAFFVLDKSPYKQIADFRGQVIAMPTADSTQSYLGRAALLQAGLRPGRDVTIDYRNTHDSCLQQVQRGLAAACVTAERTLSMLPREFSQTEKVAGVLFMAHKRLPAMTREHLQAEIVAWKNSDDGRKILQSIGFGDFVPVNIADYQHLPRLD